MRPRNGANHLYPQRDEYENAPTVSGLWSLEPTSGDLFLVVHAPSGDFTPSIDSYGRLLFTQWDHLQRDQLADADAIANGNYGTFNYSDESAAATRLNTRFEVFPEPRPQRTDLLRGTNLEGHTFNHFFPWMAHEDGAELETLEHIGRHELHEYANRSLNDDPNLRELIASGSGRTNPNAILNTFHLNEDATRRGRYLATNAPEFYTHAGGQIIALTAPPGRNVDTLQVEYLTHPETASYTSNPTPNHSGFYREARVLADGRILAVHTANTDIDRNIGTRAAPRSKYAFRLKTLRRQGGYWIPDAFLTPGIRESITYYDPDVHVSWSGVMWDLNPVEVRTRPRPATLRRAIQTEADRTTKLAARLTPAQTRLSANRKDAFLARAARLRPEALSAEITRQTADLDRLTQRLADSHKRLSDKRAERLDAAGRLLETLSYRKTLERGYAVVRADSHVVTTKEAAQNAGAIEIEFADGRMRIGGAAKPAKKPKDSGPTQGSLF